jgi:ABC-type uncharacterized transport system auxiliary subunit
MNTAPASHRPGRARPRHRRPGRLLLAAAGAAAVLLASACDTAQQVPWATYSLGLQQSIDSATATGNCTALRVLRTAAENTSHAHEKATGFPNDALVSYIEAAQARAGCPGGSG